MRLTNLWKTITQLQQFSGCSHNSPRKMYNCLTCKSCLLARTNKGTPCNWALEIIFSVKVKEKRSTSHWENEHTITRRTDNIDTPTKCILGLIDSLRVWRVYDIDHCVWLGKILKQKPSSKYWQHYSKNMPLPGKI